MATEIAEVGFSVPTQSLKEGDKALGALVPTAGRVEKAQDGLERQTKKTNSTFGKLTGGSVSLGGAFSKLVGGLKSLVGGFAGLVTGAIAGFAFTNMIMGARELSVALGELSTLLPQGSKMIGEMQDAARAMADEFGTNAAFQLKAFYGAVSAGADTTEKAMSIVSQANKLAIGGITDVATGVDILTTSTNAYAASGLLASSASDALFVGMKAGKTTIGELASGLGNVIPIAASLGVEFDELVAGTAALTLQGLSTSTAITSLRAILSGIAKPTSEASKLAKELGLDFSTTALRSKGLAGFLQDVIEKTGGSADKLSIMFGSVEALNAALAFAGEGGNAFVDILEKMQNKAGATDQALETVRSGLDNRLGVALQKITNVATDLGYVLLSVLVPAFEMLADFIVFVADGFAKIKNSFGVIYDWADAQVNLSTATENVALAMGDEINNANQLFGLMGQGNTMTQSAALAKLSEAEAHLRNAQSLREETQALVDNKMAALELQRITAQDALRSIAPDGTDLEKISAIQRASYEETEQFLVRVMNDQKTLTNLTSETNSKFAAMTGEVERIRTAITNAVDGMVTFDGKVYTAKELSEKLRVTLGNVNASGAIASVAFLAHDLGVTLGIAEKLNATLNANAGIESAPKKPKFSFGLAPVETGEVGNMVLGFGNLDKAGAKTRRTVVDLSTSVGDLNSKLSGGGGSSTSGAAGSATEALTKLEQISKDLGTISEPFDQAKTAYSALDTALNNGVINNDTFVSSLERIQKAFLATGGTAEQWGKIVNGQTDSVAIKMKTVGENALSSLGDKFIDVATGGSASFGDLASSIVKDLLKIAYEALVVKPILESLENIGGGSSGGGFFGGILKGIGALFSAKGNAFDASGLTPFAKGGSFTNSIVDRVTPFTFAQGGALGVMGEAGPEAIMPLTRGSNGSLGVQMYGGNQTQPKQTNVNNSVEITNVYRMEGAVSEERIVASVRVAGEATKEEVKQSMVGWMNEYQTNGGL